MEVTTITSRQTAEGFTRSYLSGNRASFPCGLEILLLVEDIDPLPEDDEIDKDLWEFLRWIIAGVGGEWTLEALESTGYLYRVPFARRPVK